MRWTRCSTSAAVRGCSASSSCRSPRCSPTWSAPASRRTSTWLAELEARFAGEVKRAAEQAYATIGHEVNLGSPKQLQQVLFEELGLPKTKKIKTGYTTDADALQDLYVKTEHPFLEHLLRHRDVARLKTVVDSLIPMVDDHEPGIHTTFNQLVAATGRLSSTDPNLQNIPIRTIEGREIRKAFVVGDGFECLMTADYSQIEMRIMAHLSRDAGLIEAFTSGEDLHTFVAATAFGIPVDAVEPASSGGGSRRCRTAWPTACRRSASPRSSTSPPTRRASRWTPTSPGSVACATT